MTHREFVIHLTPAGGLQASARIARFMADELMLPILDSQAAIDHEVPKVKGREFTLYFVNGPIAFSSIRDALGEKVLPFTKRIVWIQNDYTISMPPHHSYSRPTTAETPFRREFFHVPEIELWSTCEDVLSRRGGRYINWNALTYAPIRQCATLTAPRVLYYGALREGRAGTFNRLLNSPHVDISMSRAVQAVRDEWAGQARKATLLDPVTDKVGDPHASLNANRFGCTPLIPFIGRYRHSIYISDHASAGGLHSPANRFYEVLSTPDTVLWLDVAGEDAYRHFGLQRWERFAVGTAKDWERVVRMPEPERIKMAAEQRRLWLDEDPFKVLCRQLRKAVKS